MLPHWKMPNWVSSFVYLRYDIHFCILGRFVHCHRSDTDNMTDPTLFQTSILCQKKVLRKFTIWTIIGLLVEYIKYCEENQNKDRLFCKSLACLQNHSKKVSKFEKFGKYENTRSGTCAQNFAVKERELQVSFGGSIKSLRNHKRVSPSSPFSHLR